MPYPSFPVPSLAQPVYCWSITLVGDSNNGASRRIESNAPITLAPRFEFGGYSAGRDDQQRSRQDGTKSIHRLHAMSKLTAAKNNRQID